MRRYEGPVTLVASAHDAERALADVRRDHVIGFDTETRPTFHKGQYHPPSLAQVATGHGVYLFQLKKSTYDRALAEMLEEAAVVKSGIALADDIASLKALFPFREENVVDLGAIAKQHGATIQTGVRNLAGMFLGFRITKGPRTSNWARAHLSPAQIAYAATDAWVCRELYLCFERKGWTGKEGRRTHVAG